MQVLARPGMPSLDKVVGWTAQLVEQGWPLLERLADELAARRHLEQADIDRIARPAMWKSPRWSASMRAA